MVRMPIRYTVPFLLYRHPSQSCLRYLLRQQFITQFNFRCSERSLRQLFSGCGRHELLFYWRQFGWWNHNLVHWTHGTYPLPPTVIIGYQQCRYGYYPDRSNQHCSETSAERDFPGVQFVLDIHYMDAYKIFTLGDPKTFPDPKSMIKI